MRGLVIDLFAGGGGASSGIERALNRPVDIAVNHSAAAIALHTANHPETRHYREDIWKVDPKTVCGGRHVDVLWVSPDCTHHSKARGSKPVSKKIRSLAWATTRWMAEVGPRLVGLENVEEFEDWGPLDADGNRDKSKLGKTFRAFVARMINLGYEVQWRQLCNADYGAPTTRKRLYLIARNDGQPIVWPEPTHGVGRAQPWRMFADFVDWSLPCPSIFLTREQARAFRVRRPLAEATLSRIAKGLDKFVLNNPNPFIVPVNDNATGVEPFIVRHGHYSTITGAGLQEGKGCGTFRGQSLRSPIATVCATNDKHLVAPIITKHYGGPNGHATPGSPLTSPLPTVTSTGQMGLTAAFMSKFYGTSVGSDLRKPMPTATGQG
ncbi:MAG TPA: DNA cytosine methyltransferase, partial [Polyangiaceae bacterium]|nr:DNA cytosine methyltransferase [Polyangiaceae bacterium]